MSGRERPLAARRLSAKQTFNQSNRRAAAAGGLQRANNPNHSITGCLRQDLPLRHDRRSMPYALGQHRKEANGMHSPPTNCRLTISRMASVAFVAMLANEPGAEGLPLTSADGIVIKMGKLSPSTRFAGFLTIWWDHSYEMSVPCNLPRACYAKSQVINYHFRCWPRYIVAAEVISMDLNGNIVNHQVLEPMPMPNYYVDADHEVLNRFCGPAPDRPEPPERRPSPEPREKPRQGH